MPGKLVERRGWLVPEIDAVQLDLAIEEAADIPLFLSFLTQRRTCIQAGGNLGIWPVALSGHFELVLTFEPDAENFACLTRNIERAADRRIASYNVALGAKSGLCSVDRISPSNVGAHQIKHGLDVPVWALDVDFPMLPPVDLIQLDVEGSEHDALLGAEQTIKRDRPLIVLELKGLGARYGHTDDETIALLASWGYGIVDRIHRDVVFRALGQPGTQAAGSPLPSG